MNNGDPNEVRLRNRRQTLEEKQKDLKRHDVEMFVLKATKSKPFHRAMQGVIRACRVDSLNQNARVMGHCMFSNEIVSPRNIPIFTGGHMEETVAMIKGVTTELEESKKVLENLHNDITKLGEIIQPALLEHIKRIRESRMTVVREVSETLGCLRDIRKFFVESEHTHEMERLERFVKLCKEIKDLKECGILDGVLDSVVRLALKEESK